MSAKEQAYQDRVDAYVARVVAQAPPLTDRRARRLAQLLAGDRP